MIKVEKRNKVQGALISPVYDEVLSTLSKKIGERSIETSALVATNADGQEVDANETSIDRLDRVLSVGIAKILLEQFPDNPQWDVSFPWIDSNNTVISITLRQAVELQEDALNKLKDVFIK